VEEFMKKVAGYGRVSTQMQALKGTSSEEQKKVIENECKAKGYELAEFYSDDGFSGRNDERPGLKRLMIDAKENKYNLIMFAKLDRLGRNLRDVKNILYEFDAKSIEYYSVGEPWARKDSANPVSGNLMVNILSSFAEFESGIIRQRTTRGRMLRWQKNESFMGSLPFSYEKDVDGKIAVNESKRKIYNNIVSLYLDQHFSMRDVALKLKADGILSPARSSKWHSATIRDILRNRAYTGEAIYNQHEYNSRQSKSGKQYFATTKIEKSENEWIVVKYPPLISKERFELIQKIIEQRKGMPKKRHVGREDHFMAENVLFCGYCGAKIHRKIYPIDNFKYCCYWWAGPDKELKINNRERCQLHYIDADKVDFEIFSQVVNILSNPDSFAEAWYKNQNYEDLKHKVDTLREITGNQKINMESAFKRASSERDIDVKEIYNGMLDTFTENYKLSRDNLKQAEIELDFIKTKVDRLKEYKKAISQSSKRGLMKKYLRTEGQFKEFLYNLPLKEKKRILEAVVSPEAGGKCIIRHVTPFDFEDDIEDIPQDDLHKPLWNRNPLIDCQFNVDLNKIEALISSLNGRELLNSVSTR
jgi:site-specific DNA recombinase